MLAAPEGVISLHTDSASYGYRTTIEVGAGESYTDQTRRRAARWYSWLKSSECTLQDRENFERWCTDAANAAAYVALCGGLAWAPEVSSDLADGAYAAQCIPPHASSPPLVADP